jgi:hypothetical protein
MELKIKNPKIWFNLRKFIKNVLARKIMKLVSVFFSTNMLYLVVTRLKLFEF